MLRRVLRVGLLAGMVACAPSLDTGEWGNVRYFGDLLGAPPMRLVPPLTDRAGNVYVLYGAPNRQDTQVFVGRVSGGWSGGCAAHRGLYGLHGFVGRTQERVWYWSGTALVEVNGPTGACRQILANDPVSGTELAFLGVAPYVDETPSRRFAYALVQGATGAPTFLMVDLDRRLPFNTTAFDVDSEGEIVVIGTGVWRKTKNTLFVVRAEGATRAYFLDRLGSVSQQFELDVPPGLEAYSVPGFLEFSDDGVGAGVTTRGRLLVVTREEGRLVDPPFALEGVLAWGGRVYATGLEGGDPVLAEVRGLGEFGDTLPFTSARLGQIALSRPLDVSDERGEPARLRTWDQPTTAIGNHVLLSPWTIDAYTLDSAGWLIAGPSFDSGVEPVTATAFAPLGVEIP